MKEEVSGWKQRMVDSEKPKKTKKVSLAKELISKFKGYEKNINKKISQRLDKKMVNRKILKSDHATLTIKEYTPEPYKPIYFKNAYEKEKKLFFS